MTAELSKTNKAKRLKGFEAVRGVLLEPTPFSVSTNLKRCCDHSLVIQSHVQLDTAMMCDLRLRHRHAVPSSVMGRRSFVCFPKANGVWHGCSGGG